MKTEFDIVTRIGSFNKVGETNGEVVLNGTHDASIEEVKDFTSKINNLMDNKNYYLVVYLNATLGSFQPEIWYYLGKDKLLNNLIDGTVVVTSSMGYKLQINVFFKKYKPDFPLNITNTSEEAYEWINTLKSFISE